MRERERERFFAHATGIHTTPEIECSYDKHSYVLKQSDNPSSMVSLPKFATAKTKRKRWTDKRGLEWEPRKKLRDVKTNCVRFT